MNNVIAPAVDYHKNTTHKSRSQIATFAESPRTYEAMHVTKTIEFDEESDALTVGTGTHAIALNDALELDKILIIPDEVLASNGARRGKLWDQFEADNAGLTLMKRDQYELCKNLADAIDREIGSLLRNPRASKEKEYYWHLNGHDLRCKLDYVIPMAGGIFPDPWEIPHQIVIDLKTAAEIDQWSFQREVKNRRLWLQDAIYSECVEQDTNQPVRFMFAVVHKKAPFRVRLRELGATDRNAARIRMYDLLSELKVREESGDWSESGEGLIETIPQLKELS